MAGTVFEGGLAIRYQPLGHFEFSLSGAANLPSQPDENRVRRTVIRPLGADVTFCDDGTEPSATHGMPIKDGEILVYDGHDLSIFRIFCALTADVRIAYYGT